MPDDLKKQIIEIIESVSGSKLPDLNPDCDIREQVHLDSMQFVTIAAKIETEFDIDLPIEIMAAKTFNEFLSIIQAEVGNTKKS